MTALACALLLASWLWWSGLEVPVRTDHAALLLGLGMAFLGWGLWRAGRRLPPLLRLARSAGWSLVSGALCVLLAFSAEPLVDRLAPFASAQGIPARPVAIAARLLGLDAAALGDRLVVQEWSRVPAHAMSVHQVGAVVAGVLLVILGAASISRRRGRLRLWLAAGAIFAAWIPLRFLLVAKVVDDFDWLGAHWQPLAAAASWLPALWVTLHALPQRSLASLRPGISLRGAAAWGLLAAGAGCISLWLLIEPPGRRAEGRILMDGAHSDWEWTHIPFNREIYGRQSTYNYYCLIDYLAHHYPVMHVNDRAPLSDELLAAYDVLILKTPTSPFLEDERAAVVRFVERGGGLLLISDHTNLFGMTTYLNPMGEPFGVAFDTDDTFQLTTGQPTRYTRGRLGAHPIVAHMPEFEFETSCTLRPSWRMTPVMVGRGMGSEQVDYEHVNFFGNIIADPDERWGAFLQAGALHHGAGRVAAFTDSTVWSNFSVFYRGKPELALGLVEFLNRRSTWSGSFGAAALIGLGLALCAGALLTRSGRRAWREIPGSWRIVMHILAVVAGAAAGGSIATAAHASWYPLPDPGKELVSIAFDRSHSSYRLPTLLEASVSDPQSCFDAFFVTIQRLHLFPREAESLEGAMVGARTIVILNPAVAPTEQESKQLEEWVRGGGTLLVMEPISGAHVIANRFLEPAGLRITAAFPGAATGSSRGGVTILGGTPMEWPQTISAGSAEADPNGPGLPLVARAMHGDGRVIALLGSEALSFQKMGPAFNDPTATQRPFYELVYALFDSFLEVEGRRASCPLSLRSEPAGTGPVSPAGGP